MIEVTTNIDKATAEKLFLLNRGCTGGKGLCNILEGKYHEGVVCPGNRKDCRNCAWCNDGEVGIVQTANEIVSKHPGWEIRVIRDSASNEKYKVNGLQIIIDKKDRISTFTLGQQNGTGIWGYELQVEIK